MNINHIAKRVCAPRPAAWAAWLLLTVISCHAADKTTILVVGDSLSSGYRLAPGDGWVELLQRDFNRRGRTVELINDSITGDTTAGGAARIKAALERTAPDLVIIELGGNDGLRGNSLIAMEQNLRKMIRQTRAAGAEPVLFGMKLPPNYGAKYTEAFARTYRRLAAATNTPLLPFFLQGIENNFDLFQPDRVHPNAEAQPIIMQNVRGFLDELNVGG